MDAANCSVSVSRPIDLAHGQKQYLLSVCLSSSLFPVLLGIRVVAIVVQTCIKDLASESECVVVF